MARPEILIAYPMIEANRERLAADYEIHYVPEPAKRGALLAVVGARIRAVITNGSLGLTAEEMSAMPLLGLICTPGAGYEKVDLAAARQRGITVTHGSATNDKTVADHAMALMLGVMRDLVTADRVVRDGGWNGGRHLRPTAYGKRLGILGMGRIGLGIARRAAGFDMTISYHNRTPRSDVAYKYCADPVALAWGSDILMVAAPGGPTTRHMVDRAVLEALGPTGFLVNIGRGSIVDTEALVEALHDGAIAGAALDVLEGEPDVTQAVLDAPNLLLTPHIAGRSPEANAASLQRIVDNLEAHFAGRPPLTPVPFEAEEPLS
jgi:D-3-phosphoglycerate dehydrogenase